MLDALGDNSVRNVSRQNISFQILIKGDLFSLPLRSGLVVGFLKRLTGVP